MNTSLKDAVKEMVEIIGAKLPSKYKKKPVNLYISEGIAIHFHTASRVSKDLDAIIDKNISIPSKLKVIWQNEQGEFEELSYDHNYSPTLGLMHEDFDKRAIYQFSIDEKLNVFLLDPIDLIISKLSRFGEQDQEDIRRIIQNDLVKKEDLVILANDAIAIASAGRPETLKLNLDLILEMFDEYT